VSATQAVAALPAVATLDWCDRAAAALCELYRPAVACMLIATVDAQGRVLELEAAGMAASHEALPGAGAPKPAIAWQERDDEAASVRDPHLEDMRCRAERLSSIGFCPGDTLPTDGLYAPISQLPGGWGWRSTTMGPMWAWLGTSEVLVGIARLGNAVPGRSVVAYVAPAQREGNPDPQAHRLAALLPVLCRKALAAIGPLRSSRSRWISAREQIVLDQLILGKSVRQIAEELGRSPHTVHDHVKALHRKLNASSRGELIARALGYITEASRIRHAAKPSISTVQAEAEAKPLTPLSAAEIAPAPSAVG
jgi:DNA-binding CsgD family transcriptional regulator